MTKHYDDIADAHTHIGHFIEQVYNLKRPHSALGYLAPFEFEQKNLSYLDTFGRFGFLLASTRLNKHRFDESTPNRFKANLLRPTSERRRFLYDYCLFTGTGSQQVCPQCTIQQRK